ncbi:hypothetical protein MRX96_029771 [Rhipicephalus microplus]
MATARGTRTGMPCRNFYSRKAEQLFIYGSDSVDAVLCGAVKDIFERVAPGDDVSDLSDLSEGYEDEWTAPSPWCP